MAVSTGTDYRVVVTHSQTNEEETGFNRSRRNCNSQAPRWLRTPLILILLISVGSFGLPRVQGKDGELCVVETPLKTSYFIPFVQTPNPCSGCWYPKPDQEGNKSKPASATHVLQIENSIGGIIELTLDYRSSELHPANISSNGTLKNAATVAPPQIDPPKQVVVVVSSQTSPISLYIIVEPQARNVSIALITRPRDVVSFHSPAESSITIQDWEDSSAALEKVKKEFGHISSYSKANNVNKITLGFRPELPSSDDECSASVNAESPIAECSIVVRKETSGCYHENMIGVNKRDIHIIEIEDDYEKTSNSSISLFINGVTSRRLAPRSQSDIIKRNITLVLRSGHPTFWTIRVSNLQGIVTLLVGDGDQVENKSSSGQNLVVTVKRQELPKSFDQMFLAVLTKIGPPISYTHTESPSIINIIVPHKQELTVVEKIKTTTTQPQTQPATLPENVNRLIDSSARVECQKSEVTVSVPLWVAKSVGGVVMSLRDQACQGIQNGTHVILRSKFSECGFFQEEVGGSYLYTNFAHIDPGRRLSGITDDEDFEGSGFGPEELSYASKVPTVIIQCKTSFRVQDKKELENYQKELKYSLTVFHDEDFTQPYLPKEFPIPVSADIVLYAEVKFAKEVQNRAYETDLKILIESCILSASEHYISSPTTLIRKSCAFQPYITIKKSYLNANLAFHFQLSLEFLPSEKVFLHCQIGVCSSDPLPKPSINKCVDPDIYCNKDSLMNAFSNQAFASYVNTLVVGPFIVQPSKDALSGTRNFFPNSPIPNRVNEQQTQGDREPDKYGASERKTQIIVMEGLSTEIVVGIAIASFIIGVCLTATLWIIYLKTDPRRQKRPECTMPQNSAYDLSAHSGSSTPSSQAPISA